MTSIFADKKTEVFTRYGVTLQFRSRVLGGIPKDPKLIEGWLRSKAGIDDAEEVRQAMLRTLIELGAEVTPDMTFEQLEEASNHLAAVKQTQGFKLDGGGLFVEDRQVKAMLRESVNILYAGERWGTTKKGPKNFFNERVFVDPERIHFTRDGQPVKEPDGVELMIVHIEDARGRRSSLAYHEYLERVEMSFDVIVLQNLIEAHRWPELWIHAEENGFGASRSQSFGRFDVTRWERL